MEKEMINTPTFLYTRENVKERIKTIKSKLPRDYRKVVKKMYPEYNTIEGMDLLNNVVALRSTDLRLCEILERIAHNV